MNCNFRSLWNESTGTFVAVSEIASSAGKKTSSGMRSPGTGVHFCLQTLAACVLLSLGATVYALPTGGAVVAGAASISSGALSTTINQSTQNAAINWQSFNIATGEAVRVLQPNSSSVLLNRVLGSDPSNILGSLTANGKVFLVNPNGILFGRGASVNTAGLVASTLNVTDSDFMAGRYQFAGNSTASVLNQGSIQADGGYVALLGANVTNGGVIQARLGSVALAAGSAMTLDVAGDGLLHVSVSQGALNALAQNGGLIQADGGQVLLSAQSAGALLQSAVNNTGVIQAQTIENHQGMIRLLGDMQSGTLNVGGTLDAGAPKGGSGGLVETSAAHVNISDSTSVTTRSAQGSSGHWLIDPADFTIAASGGNISGSTLSGNLAGGPITILSSSGSAGGSGDINVNAAVSWSANLLTLTAARNININAVMTASGTSSLALNTATANGADLGVLGGTVKVGMNADGFTGRVDFPARSGATFLSINALPITVIDTLGAPGSITGTDLQGINGSAANLAKNYALGADIPAAATSGWNAGAGFLPIGVFTGTFDGLGHTVTGLTINRTGTANVGLFGQVAAGTSTIRNVGLVGGSISGDAGTGGLIGTSGAGVTVSNSFNTGSVSGDAGTGGLIGSNGAGNAVSDSYATGSVNGTVGQPGIGGLIGSNGAASLLSYNYATGSVTSIGGASVGGLVGSNGALSSVKESFATGSVSSTVAGGAGVGGLLGSNTTATVTDSYATGNVTNNGAGSASTGGLVGSNTTGAVSNTYAAGLVTAIGAGVGGLMGSSGAVVVHSYWDTTTSGQAASAGGGFGMTTAQMKAQLNFTSSTAANFLSGPTWNFVNTWFMYENISYPLLRHFMTPLTVTANNDSKIYNGLAYSGGNGVSYSTTTNPAYLLGALSYSSGGTSVGSYTITPSGQYSNQKGYIIGYANGTLTINPAHLTVTADDKSRTYGAPNPALSTTVSGFVNGETAVTATGFGGTGSASTTAVVGTGVGGVVITAGAGTLTATNYDFPTLANGTLTINPASLTVTASNVSKAYGQTVTPSAFTAAGLVNGDTVGSVTETSPGTVATAAVAGSPYAITPSAATGGTFVPANYTIGYVNGVLTVTPIALTITASNVAKAYGQVPTLSAFTSAGLVNGDTVGSVTETSPGSVATAPVAGSPYVITPSGATGGSFVPGNYTVAYVNGALTVTPAVLTITANDASKRYGQSTTLPASAFTSTGLVNGDAVTGVSESSPGTVASAPVAGSPYAITPSAAVGTFVPGNYTLHYVNGALVVTPVALTVTANDVTKSYGQTPILSGFTTTPLVNGDVITSVTESSPGQAATAAPGTSYPITVSNATGAGFTPSNYSIGYVDGVLTVIQLPDVIPPGRPFEGPTVIPTNRTPVPPLVVVSQATPPQLLSLVPPVLVERPILVPAEPPVLVPQPAPAPVVTPLETPPSIEVPLHRPRKQDRN